MRASITLLTFVAFIAFTSALPGTLKCARYCRDHRNTFGYEIGKTYTYYYKGNVRSLINSTRSDESGIQFTSQVDIRVISTCDFSMKILRVSLEETLTQNGIIRENRLNDADFKRQLEENVLFFSFHNGKIDTICPGRDEEKEILDIKRAVLSVFQNSMHDLKKDTLIYETDITGNCETSYKVLSQSRGAKGISVMKSKNLDACTHRMSNYLSWQTVPYLSNSQSKSLPLLRSTLNCIQKYNQENIMESSICDEKHLFEPFSHNNNGAVTIIKQEMLLKSITTNWKNSRVPKNMLRTSLIYETSVKSKININPTKTLELLNELETKTSDGVDTEVPKIFSRLIYDFQNFDKDELLLIFDNMSQKQRKFYIDAISLITTTAGIEVMRELYNSNKINNKEMGSWILSLTFIKSPTLDTITAVKPLFQFNATRQNTVLAVSSILYRYCKKYTKCLEERPVLQILEEIESPLRNSCVATGIQNKNDIILALKGLGNAGITSSLRLLHSCYSNQDSSIELRLAAIAAHRRMNCVHNFNLDDFRNYFSDIKENSEIRIASYLATMQCASYASFAQVKDVLLHEETNQVGSFVWTHLTNLQETSTPWKQGLRKLLENEFLKNKFNTDVRKYSRNYEASTFFDSIGAGVAVESNLVFSTDSYLLRSAMLNFTLDLFGETINVFEIGGRMEGFEEIVEHLFGPEGYFSDKSIKSFLENAKNSHGEFGERIKTMGDNFRSQKVLQKDPTGMVYAKIFGNEISYSNFNSLHQLIGDPMSTKQAIDLALNLIRENNIDFKKSFMFLDSSYKVPTILGFPLELIANGTATVGLTVQGKLDLKDLWSYKFAIDGKIYPSASIQVVGSMSVNAILTKCGVQYIGNMNSNSYIDGHAFINAGKIVDIKINVPKKQMDIINVASDVYVIHNIESYKIQELSDYVEDDRACSQELFSKITGLQICYQLKYINASQILEAPKFPLTGGFRYGLNIKKTDDFDSYQVLFNMQTERHKDKPIYAMSIYIDTPNSLINRKMQVSYNIDLQNLSLNAKLISPFANMEVNSNLGNEYNKYSFQMQTLFNNKEVLSLQSSFKVNAIGEGLKYEPLAKLKYQEKQIAAISGSISYMHVGQYSADLKLEGITEDPIVIAGDLMYINSMLNIRTAITSKLLTGKLQAQFQNNDEALISTANLNYSLRAGKEENIALVWQVNKIRTTLTEDVILLRFESSQMPMYNIYLQLLNQRSKWFLKNVGKLILFETTWKLDQLIKFEKFAENPDIDVHCYISCEEKDIDYRLAVIYNNNKTHLNTHALLQLNQIQKIEAMIYYRNEVPLETIKVLLYYLKQSFNFEGKLERDQQLGHIFDFNGKRKTNGIEKHFISIVGSYKNSSNGILKDYKLNLSVDFYEENARLAAPWKISGSMQKSNELFIGICEFITSRDNYIGNMNWLEGVFTFNIQANDKRLMMIKGSKSSETLAVILGLNVYQHFELSAKLLLPLEKFEVQFYWDKDRDENQKFTFGIEKNYYKGLYSVIMEYPNQRISAVFVLLPTMVTMNVTWGIQVSQRIYLKVGNKVYDIGGLWFGELESPFQYLEKQEFQLKYYVLPTNFEVQSDISWRSHSIHFLVSGSKSEKHIAGNLQLNTTLSEISKIGIDLLHTHQANDNYNTGAIFIYNKNQIKAESNWKLDGINVDSNFIVESPSGVIYPIAGILNVNCSSTTNLTLELYWQKRAVTMVSSFKTDASNVLLKTPFDGFEMTRFEYAVKSYQDTVSLLLTIDLFKQYNHVNFDWVNTNDSILFWMDLTSPVTGYYSWNFTHSTVLGILKETFIIKGREDIILLKLQGNVMPIWDMKVTANLHLLEHKAALSINNEPYPLTSTIKAEWNDFNIISTSSATFNKEEIKTFTSRITSNILDEDIELRYNHENNIYFAYLELPKKQLISNILNIDASGVNNNFTLQTIGMISEILYKHDNAPHSFEQYLKVNINENSFNYSLNFSSDEFTNLDLVVEMPYDSKSASLVLNFKLNALHSEAVIDYHNSLGNILKMDTGYNLIGRKQYFQIQLDKDDSVLTVNVDRDDYLNIKSKTLGDYFPKPLNFEAKASFTQNSDARVINLIFLNSNSYDLQISLAKNWLNADVVLFKNSDEIAIFKLLIGKNNGSLIYRENFKNNFKVILNYVYNNTDFASNILVKSNSAYNSKFLINYNLNKILIDGYAGDHRVCINGTYLINLNNANKFSFDSNLHVLYKLSNETLIDFVVEKLYADIVADDSNGKLAIGLRLNHFEKWELKTEYSIETRGMEAVIDFYRNENLYKIDFIHAVSNNIFEISTKIVSPELGTIKIESNTLKNSNDYTSQFICNVNDNLYIADVITAYVNKYDCSFKFQINSPEAKHSADIEISLKESQKIDLTLALFDGVNKLSFNNSHAVGFIFASVQLDCIELAPQTLNINYNFDSPKKTFLINYNNDDSKYGVKGEITAEKLNVRVDNQDVEDYIVIGGTHTLNSIKDFSVIYNIVMPSNKIKIELLHYCGEKYQTKIDITSSIRGWNRLTLESKLDQDKIRISVNAKNHRISLVVKKFHPDTDDLISLTYQGESLLLVSAGSTHMTITTNTNGMFGEYKLFIQCTHNPGIYAFSILKNGENLISLMLQNYTTDIYTQFKAKLVAPDLIPTYSSIGVQFHVDNDISKSLNFKIYNGKIKLFEIKWARKRNPYEYSGFFIFNSKIEMLQNFEIHPILNLTENFIFKTNISLVSNKSNNNIQTVVVLPLKQPEMKLSLIYPCIEYRICNLFINIRPKLIEFEWTSPLEDWKNISLLTTLESHENSLAGIFRITKNTYKFHTNFDYKISDNFIAGNINLNNDLIQFYNFHYKTFNFSGIYTYYKTIDLVANTDNNPITLYADIDYIPSKMNITITGNNRKLVITEELGYNEEVDFKIIADGINRLILKKDRILNQSHSQFLKFYMDIITLIDFDVYYNFADSNNHSMGLHYYNKLYNSNITACAEFPYNFSNGSVKLDYGYDNNKVEWFAKTRRNLIIADINFQHNKHLTTIQISHEIGSKTINSSLHIDCAGREMDFNFEAEKHHPDLIKASILLKTPLPVLESMKMQTTLKYNPDHYYIYNTLVLPKHQFALKATADFEIDDKLIDLDFVSTFTHPIKSKISYKYKDTIDLFFNTEVTGEYITLVTKFQPLAGLHGNLSSSFKGFETCNLIVNFNNKTKILNIIFSKENLTFKINGSVYKQVNNNNYELDMKLEHPNGDLNLAKAYLILKNETLNASLIIHDIFINVGLYDDIYNINLQTPYYYARDVNLKGIYSNDVDVYTLETNGNWNDVKVDLNGLFQLERYNVSINLLGKVGNDYKASIKFIYLKRSKDVPSTTMEFVGYFPNEESNANIKFESQHNIANINVKTPFKLSTLNVRTYFKKYEKIDIDIVGDVDKKRFVFHNVASMNSTNIDTNMQIAIPHLNKNWFLLLNSDYETGLLNIYQKSEISFNNITLNYQNINSKFLTDFILISNIYNVTHNFALLYKNEPSIEYGVIFDDHKIIEMVTTNKTHAIFNLNAVIPYLNIYNMGINTTKYKHNQITSNLVYNHYYISQKVEYKMMHYIRTDCKFKVPYLLRDNYFYKSIWNKTKDGFIINILEMNQANNITAIYTNNDNIFNTELIIDQNIAEIFLAKNLEKIQAKITNIFTLLLENGDKNKFLASIYHPKANHTLELEFSNNSLLIKLESPSLEQQQVQIILNTFTATATKKFNFFYNERNKIIYQGSIYVEELIKSKYVMQAILSKQKHQFLNIEALISENTVIDINMNVEAFNFTHKADLKIHAQHPYIAKIDLKSPYIDNNRFTIDIEITTLKTTTLLIASGNLELGNYIFLESFFDNNFIFISLLSPNYEHLKLLNLSSNWDFTDNNTLHLDFKTISDIVGDILVQTEFLLKQDLLNIETHFKIPFLKSFETFDGVIYIPKEFRPKVEFVLPGEAKYSLIFDHNILNQLGYVLAEYQYNEYYFKYLLNYNLIKYSLVTNLVIPHDQYRYIALIINNPHFEIQYNNRKYTFDYNYINNNERKLLEATLATPYQHLAKYAINLEYSTKLTNVIKFLLIHPDLKRPIGINFEVTYINTMTLKLIYQMYSPYPINGFDFAEIHLLHELNHISNMYSLECKIETNNHSIHLNLGGIKTDHCKKITLETSYNNKSIFTHFDLIGNIKEKMQLYFDYKIKPTQNFKLSFNSSTNFAAQNHNDEALIIFNNLEYVNSKLKIENKNLELILKNIWQPFSINYKYIRDNTFDVCAKICYNLNQPKSSTLGAYLYLGNTLSTGVYLPNQTYTADLQFQKNATGEFYQLKIALNNKLIIATESYQNITTPESIKIQSNVKLQLPLRTFQLFQNFESKLISPEINSTMQIKWGNLAQSELFLKNQILPGKLISSIHTAALQHPLILTIDMSKFGAIPSEFKAAFQYSNNTNKLIQFEMYYNRIQLAGIFATQRNFIVKHPISKINYELYFNAHRRHAFSNGSLILKYLNYDNLSESIQASVKVDHDKFGILGEVVTSKNNFNFNAASTSSDDSIGFLIKTKVNDKDPLHLGCDYNFKQTCPALNLEASYGDSRKYIFYAGLPNDKEITAKTWHELYGKQSLDTLLTMRLNTSQLLWIKLLWKNEIYMQFHKAIFEEYNDLRFVIEASGKELIDVIDDDIGKQFIEDMRNIKQSLIAYGSEEKKNLIDDFKDYKLSCSNSSCSFIFHPEIEELFNYVLIPLEKYLHFVYNTFDSAFSNIFSSIQYTLDVINVQLQKALKDIKNIKSIKINAKDILRKGISDARKSLKEMETIVIKLLDDFDKYVGYLKLQVENLFEPFLNLLDDLVAYVEQRLAILQIAIMNVLDKIQTYIFNLREIKEVLLTYSTYINWLEELHLTDFLEPVGDVIEEILETVITDIKRVLEHYRQYLDALSEAIFGKYDAINQLPPITEFREYVNRFYQKTIWIWNYHNMTEGIKTAIFKLSSDIDNMLSIIELNDRGNDFDLPFEQTDYIFRPEIGLIEISQPLPVEWEAFNKPPAFQQHPLYQKIQLKADQFIKIYKNRYDFIDNFEDFCNIFIEPTIIPPTYNFAMLIGNTHYVTFNNGFYDFISNCSYVLAGDFKTNSFTLITNYKNDTNGFRRTLEIVAHNSSIEIDGSKVLFNKESISLPLIYEHLLILKEHENIIVESSKGLKIVCNIRYNYCTIELSGWLFGKTGGLLGTLDNELSSDMFSSNGTLIGNIIDFAYSWKIQDTCVVSQYNNDIKNMPIPKTVPVMLMNGLCTLYYKNLNSPLAECFDVIDPKHYLDMCTEGMSNEDKPTLCTTIAAYRNRCKKANVVLDMTPLCLKCDNMPAKSEGIFDGHNPKSIDVVFITQLDCFRETNVSLPLLMNQQLKQSGYYDVRFASVGYGGRTLNKPHVYTTSDNIWTTSDQIQIKYTYGYERWNGQKYKSVDAIKYALNLDFRPGIPKLFILSHCEFTNELANSPQIYNMLGEKDVTLHLLKPNVFENYNQDVVGLNADNLVVSGARDIVYKDDKIINTLTDVFSGLALSTNGTVFDFDGFNLAPKWGGFVTSTARRSPCQKCKCVADIDGVGKVECTRCMNPTVKQFLNEYEQNQKKNFGSAIME